MPCFAALTEKFFRDLNGRPVPLYELGYQHINDLLQNEMHEVCNFYLNSMTNEITLFPISHQNTRHIEKLIARQRVNKTTRFGSVVPNLVNQPHRRGDGSSSYSRRGGHRQNHLQRNVVVTNSAQRNLPAPPAKFKYPTSSRTVVSSNFQSSPRTVSVPASQTLQSPPRTVSVPVPQTLSQTPPPVVDVRSTPVSVINLSSPAKPVVVNLHPAQSSAGFPATQPPPSPIRPPSVFLIKNISSSNDPVSVEMKQPDPNLSRQQPAYANVSSVMRQKILQPRFNVPSAISENNPVSSSPVRFAVAPKILGPPVANNDVRLPISSSSTFNPALLHYPRPSQVPIIRQSLPEIIRPTVANRLPTPFSFNSLVNNSTSAVNMAPSIISSSSTVAASQSATANEQSLPSSSNTQGNRKVFF